MNENEVVFNSLSFCFPLLYLFEKKGFKAYVVGGAIRNILLEKNIKNCDIVTNATNIQIEDIFKKNIVFKDKNFYRISFEKKEYRITSLSKKNKKKGILNDLKIRDFTINSFAFGINEGLIYFKKSKGRGRNNSLLDIKNKKLRANQLGKSFKKSPIRILRALSFSALYDLEIEPKTKKAMLRNKKLLINESNTNITKELKLILETTNCYQIFAEYKEIFAVIVPPLKKTFAFNYINCENKLDNIYSHTINVLKNTPNVFVIRLASLMHDLGKPFVSRKLSLDKEIYSFNNHEFKGYEIATFLFNDRLNLSVEERSSVLFLIYNHSVNVPLNKEELKSLIKKTFPSQIITNDTKTIYELMNYLLYLEKANDNTFSIDIALFDELLKDILNNPLYPSYKGLKIGGYDLLQVGFSENEIGDILHSLLELVLEEKVENNLKDLTKMAKKLLKEKRKKEGDEK